MGRGVGAADLTIRPYTDADLAWAEPLLVAEMGGRWQVRRGERVDALDAPGWVAERDGAPVGLLTAAPRADGWELVLLLVTERRTGVAGRLVERLLDEARATLKPEIGTTGADGLHIRDELELNHPL